MPGKIERDHKPFSCVQDLEQIAHAAPELGEVMRLADVSVLVKETVQSLNISYQLSGGKTDQLSISVQPTLCIPFRRLDVW
jgi:hypothetical protein